MQRIRQDIESDKIEMSRSRAQQLEWTQYGAMVIAHWTRDCRTASSVDEWTVEQQQEVRNSGALRALLVLLLVLVFDFERREHLVGLLRDADERRAPRQLLQVRRAHVRARRAQAAEHVGGGRRDRPAALDLHYLPFRGAERTPNRGTRVQSTE